MQQNKLDTELTSKRSKRVDILLFKEVYMLYIKYEN